MVKKARRAEIAKNRAEYEDLLKRRLDYEAELAEKDPDRDAPAAAKLSGTNPRGPKRASRRNFY
jgi:hypothetical protein